MPLPKAPFLLGEKDVVPDQAVPDQQQEWALGTMISCLSPELKQQIFSPFFWNKVGRGFCCFQERAAPFSVLMHQLDLTLKAWCGVSRIAQAHWTGVPGDRPGSG